LKRTNVIVAVIAAVLLIPSCYSLARSDGDWHESAKDRLIIAFEDSSSIADILGLAESSGASVQISESMKLAFWTGWDGGTIREVSRISSVSAVEREKAAHLSFIPNDPYYSPLYQWGLQRINADDAWDYTLGSDNITIAVLDTGVDYTHNDLSGNMWKDSGGHFGFDFWNNDNNPMDDNINGYEGSNWVPNLDIYHGTHVAGVAAALTDNGIGMAGVAQVKIMAVKVMNDSGEGTDISVAQGIEYAVDNGADIITMSLGVESSTIALKEAVEYASDHRVLLVAAAGNEGASSVSYPGAYPQVIAVGASDKFDGRASFSNYGSDLEIMAPGTDIWSTKPTNTYRFLDGTSTATPFVSGVAALMLSVNPGLTPEEVREQINSTARDLMSPGWDSETGWGLLNASAAVVAVSGPSTAVIDYPTSASANESLTIKWIVTGLGGVLINQTYLRWGYDKGNLSHISVIYHDKVTPSTFTVSNVHAPDKKNGTLYLQSVAYINGTEYTSSVAHIPVSESALDPITKLFSQIRDIILNDVGLINFILILAILIVVIVAAISVRRSRRRARAQSQPAPQAEVQTISTASPTPAAPTTYVALPADVPMTRIDISGEGLSQTPLEIIEGTRVVWRNTDWAPPPGISIVSGFTDDSGPHPDGIFASGLMVSPGEYWSCIFNVQGEYSYYISNTKINGKVVVRPKA